MIIDSSFLWVNVEHEVSQAGPRQRVPFVSSFLLFFESLKKGTEGTP